MEEIFIADKGKWAIKCPYPHCGYAWLSRTEGKPVACPKCKNRLDRLPVRHNKRTEEKLKEGEVTSGD